MKKVISLLGACFMLMSVVVAGAAELTNEQQSVLYSYGIMVGDENGDLRLNDTITRAEAVKMICCAGSMDISSNESLPLEQPFNDVPAHHWAIQYIHAAKLVGIIDGDENGNFKPEEEITYQEIIRMILSVLGYQSMADTRGGYPDGYMITATQLGLTKSLSVKTESVASRNDTAILISNALDIPMMVQSGFDLNDPTSAEYKIMNGENGTELITLRSMLDETK